MQRILKICQNSIKLIRLQDVSYISMHFQKDGVTPGRSVTVHPVCRMNTERALYMPKGDAQINIYKLLFQALRSSPVVLLVNSRAPKIAIYIYLFVRLLSACKARVPYSSAGPLWTNGMHSCSHIRLDSGDAQWKRG